MTNFFQDKLAVITGAGGLLGSAVAWELARQGARVALLGRSQAKLDAVGVGRSFCVDVTDAGARAEVARTLGSVAFLINAAGGNQTEDTTTLSEFFPDELDGTARGFFSLDPDRYLDVIRVNTMGTVIPCQVFGREMARQGCGAIVNFASMNSYRPLSRMPAYGMAKAGVVNFTPWLAAYLALAGVRVNAVAPGFFVNERRQNPHDRRRRADAVRTQRDGAHAHETIRATVGPVGSRALVVERRTGGLRHRHRRVSGRRFPRIVRRVTL